MNFDDAYLISHYGVSRESIEKLHVYEALLRKWQKAINIVSGSSLDHIWQRHIIDSLQLLSYLPQVDLNKDAFRLLDLGSGGGFPGLVIAILRPDLHVTLLDADQRKMQFLKAVSRETAIDCDFVNQRLDTYLDQNPTVPDVITARGFSSLYNILNWTELFHDQGKSLQYILLKGEQAKEEIAEAQKTYKFDLNMHASITNKDAKVLMISNVSKL